MSPQEGKKPQRISKDTGVLMVIVAVIMDLLGPIGTVGGTIIFFIWFAILNIPLIGPKQLVRWGLNLLGEVVTAGVWAGMTVGVLLMIGITRTEDKLGINVLGKVGLGKIGLKELKRMKVKTVRRMQNPARTAAAEARLERMRSKGLTPGKGSVSGGAGRSRSEMRDVAAPEKTTAGGQSSQKITQRSAAEIAETEKLRRMLGPQNSVSAKQPSRPLDEVFAEAGGGHERWADKYQPGWRDEFEKTHGRKYEPPGVADARATEAQKNL